MFIDKMIMNFNWKSIIFFFSWYYIISFVIFESIFLIYKVYDLKFVLIISAICAVLYTVLMYITCKEKNKYKKFDKILDDLYLAYDDCYNLSEIYKIKVKLIDLDKTHHGTYYKNDINMFINIMNERIKVIKKYEKIKEYFTKCMDDFNLKSFLIFTTVFYIGAVICISPVFYFGTVNGFDLLMLSVVMPLLVAITLTFAFFVISINIKRNEKFNIEINKILDGYDQCFNANVIIIMYNELEQLSKKYKETYFQTKIDVFKLVMQERLKCIKNVLEESAKQ